MQICKLGGTPEWFVVGGKSTPYPTYPSARIYVNHVEDEMKETQWVACGSHVEAQLSRGLINGTSRQPWRLRSFVQSS